MTQVLNFLLDLFKYNDNSKNTFADNYYRAALVEALGETVTPVVSMVRNDGVITSESLADDTKKVLEEVTRYLNLEKLLPCYRFTGEYRYRRLLKCKPSYIDGFKQEHSLKTEKFRLSYSEITIVCNFELGQQRGTMLLAAEV